MTKYQEPTSKVCNDCPFRRRAPQGWLGDATPESFIKCILDEELLPCHQTMDYEDPDWKEKWVRGETGKACLGALHLAANMCKLPRDPAHPRAKPEREEVFGHAREFLEYHNTADIKSWTFKDKKV